MNVLLINPPANRALPSEAGEASGAAALYPPLGLLYLQAAVEADSAHRVDVIDAQADLSLDEPLRRVARVPDLVGVAALTPNLRGVSDAVARARAVFPDAKVAIGGPHATLYPVETAALPGVDFAVAGEAETSLRHLADALAGGGDAVIPGIRRAGDDTDPEMTESQWIPDLDALPFPDRTRLNPAEYRGLAGDSAVFATMLTSRGCPYRCAFCSTPHGRTRYRSVPSILDEFNECVRGGAAHVYFVDDLFPMKGERLNALCRGLEPAARSVSWSCRTAVPGVSEDALRAMKRAGCRRIQIGVETGTEEGLRAIGKPIELDQVASAVRAARSAGVETMAYFMIGLPTEKTPADIRRTARFARRLSPTYALFNVLTLYPGSRLYDEARESGLVEGDPWRDFARDPETEIVPPVWTKHMDRATLFSLLQAAYRSFYWRPSVLLRQLRAIRSVDDLRRKLRLGLKIARKTPA